MLAFSFQNASEVDMKADDANSSSTYVYLNSDLDASFGDGEDAQGDYALDVLSIDSTVVQGMEFGIMYTTTVTVGLLGVSFPAIESIAVQGGSPYNNLPILLVNQGYIQSAAFSVWLNNDQSAAGIVLFGGVDTDKFYGNLVTLPFVEGPGDFQVQQFFVTLQGVQMTGVDGNPIPIPLTGGSTPGPALLDTGTNFILLPDAVAEAIQSQLGAVVTNDVPHVECSLASSSITVDFIFTGITINVPLSQLIDPNPGQTECILRLVESSEETVLGDPFLSSTYVVFDLDNKEAHIAQAVFGATSENIVPIGSGPNAVPSASGQPTTTISTSMISSSSSTTSTSPISSSTSTSSLSSTNSSSFSWTNSSTSNILAASTPSPILITLTTSMTTTTCITSDTSTLTATAELTHCNHVRPRLLFTPSDSPKTNALSHRTTATALCSAHQQLLSAQAI
jgi:hypothetical protein